MPSARAVEVLRQQNAGISRLIESDLRGFWRTLDLARPEATRDALLVAAPVLVAKYGDLSSTVAVDWYDEQRAEERIRGKFRAKAAAGMASTDVQKAVRFAAGHLFTEHPQGTLDYLLGATQKYALLPGRQTIARSSIRDPQASGWERVTLGGCDFCVTLADRGGVYRESTAHFAAHGHCNCTAVPSWDRSAREVSRTAYAASDPD